MSIPSPKNNPDNHPGPAASNHVEEQVSEAISAVEPARQTVDEGEFERIYRENRGKVFSTAYRMVGNRADADDITQDVFVKVYKKMDTFRGEAAVSTWIYRIAVNTSLDFLRKRKRRPTVSLEVCPEPVAGSSILGKLIETMVATLPAGYRKVFVLHDIQGLKHSEIGKALGITEGASKSQLHRARARLREKLAPHVKEWKWR